MIGIFAALAALAGAALTGAYFRYPERAFDGLISAARRYGRLTPKTVSVGDLTWHYLEGGPADGVPLVLIHGFGGNKDRFMPDSLRLGPLLIVCGVIHQFFAVFCFQNESVSANDFLMSLRYIR